MNRFINYIFIGAGAIAIAAAGCSKKNGITLTSPLGKSISDIMSQHQGEEKVERGNPVNTYSVTFSNVLGAEMFFFNKGKCIREIVLPRNNENIEAVWHYLNTTASPFIEAVPEVPNPEAYTKYIHSVTGKWILTGSTAVYFICGEKNHDPYFVITNEMEFIY